MSASTLPAEVIRTALIDNVLTGYHHAIFWDDSALPFTNDSVSICLVNSTGRESNTDTARYLIQVTLFSDVSELPDDWLALVNDATSCQTYLFNNLSYDSGTMKVVNTAESVGRPMRTGSGRWMVRFSVNVEC